VTPGAYTWFKFCAKNTPVFDSSWALTPLRVVSALLTAFPVTAVSWSTSVVTHLSDALTTNALSSPIVTCVQKSSS